VIVQKSEIIANNYINFKDGKGKVVIKPLAPKQFMKSESRLIAEISLEPDASIGGHVHTGERELFYFIEGEGEVIDENETKKVKAGDVLVTPEGMEHGVTNTGKAVLKFLAVILLNPAE
jgi:mannose-6-phosphate isomerase-like protein (cupin superfamily)